MLLLLRFQSGSILINLVLRSTGCNRHSHHKYLVAAEATTLTGRCSQRKRKFRCYPRPAFQSDMVMYPKSYSLIYCSYKLCVLFCLLAGQRFTSVVSTTIATLLVAKPTGEGWTLR
jgi:hypothetical protein